MSTPAHPSVRTIDPDLDRRTDEIVETAPPKAAHIVKTEPGESAVAKVTEARIFGYPVEALCGEVFVPQQDPQKLPMCGVCKEIYDLYRQMSDGGLNETPGHVVADRSAALAAVSEALLGIAGDLRTDAVLERLVDAARTLADARYAALGVPDEEGDGFSRWITAGLTDAEIEAIGPLPRTHGLLGAALHDPEPFRSADIRTDDRFQGWWPSPHPDLDTFLAVPIVFRGDVVGAFYLSNKDGGFTDDDQRLVRDLADHAAVLIEHSRLYEASRDLSVLEERNRLARELHDALTQSLFGLRLRLEAGDTDGASAVLDEVFAELRSLIFQLRPPALEQEGLVASLDKHLEVVGRAHHVATRLEATACGTVDPDVEQALYRIAQEALSNAVRHAEATEVVVTLARDDGMLRLTVTDDGKGFDPHHRAVSARTLGLVSMRERAADLGGFVTIDSEPGRGTTVRAEVPAR